MTKSLPLKSAIVRGSLVLPHTNRRNRDLSLSENSSSINSQNHFTKGAFADTPLYEATERSSDTDISGRPHTCVSISCGVKRERRETGMTRAIPSLTTPTHSSNSCNLNSKAHSCFKYYFNLHSTFYEQNMLTRKLETIFLNLRKLV